MIKGMSYADAQSGDHSVEVLDSNATTGHHSKGNGVQSEPWR